MQDQKTILQLFALTLVISLVATEYCYYREAKESEENYLECQPLNKNEPIEGIGLIHLKHNTTIPTIRKGLLAPFKNLKTLYITAANVETIEPGSLDNFKLEIIDLYHNNLKSIENGTFNSLTMLRYLDLSYNKLESLDKVFTGLISLEWLSVNSNQLKSIDSGSFEELKSLKALYLSYNRIVSIDGNSFNSLKQLEVLDLSYNWLQKLERNVFQNQSKLKLLNLRSNNLTNLTNGLFNSTSSLVVLDISENHLSGLEEVVFVKSKKLEILKISSNNLKEFNVSNLLNFSPSLMQVDLFYNSWKCSSLKKIVDYFDEKHVFVPIALPVLNTTVRGIGCIN